MPYTAFYTIFYLFFFSCIPHKELRFLIPSLAFVMLATGEFMHYAVFRRIPYIAAFWVRMYIFVDCATLAVYHIFHEGGYYPRV